MGSKTKKMEKFTEGVIPLKNYNGRNQATTGSQVLYLKEWVIVRKNEDMYMQRQTGGGRWPPTKVT